MNNNNNNKYGYLSIMSFPGQAVAQTGEALKGILADAATPPGAAAEAIKHVLQLQEEKCACLASYDPVMTYVQTQVRCSGLQGLIIRITIAKRGALAFRPVIYPGDAVGSGHKGCRFRNGVKVSI